MISYRFVFAPDDQLVFDVDEASDTSVEIPGEEYPEWVRLAQLFETWLMETAPGD